MHVLFEEVTDVHVRESAKLSYDGVHVVVVLFYAVSCMFVLE